VTSRLLARGDTFVTHCTGCPVASQLAGTFGGGWHGFRLLLNHGRHRVPIPGRGFGCYQVFEGNEREPPPDMSEASSVAGIVRLVLGTNRLTTRRETIREHRLLEGTWSPRHRDDRHMPLTLTPGHSEEDRGHCIADPYGCVVAPTKGGAAAGGQKTTPEVLHAQIEQSLSSNFGAHCAPTALLSTTCCTGGTR